MILDRLVIYSLHMKLSFKDTIMKRRVVKNKVSIELNNFELMINKYMMLSFKKKYKIEVLTEICAPSISSA